jgi:hypothetical protein
MTDPEVPKKYKFDAFLSHNSKDKAAVEKIARILKKKGIKVWFDKWNLIPGKPWMEALEDGIKNSRCILVFLGEAGFGKWENEEMRAALTSMVAKLNESVIPVLLPGIKEENIYGQLFLGRNTWVKFQEDLDDPAALELLIAGILGVEPGDIEELLKKRKKMRPRPTQGEHLPFVNREDVIKFIFADQSPAYHLIDAPAGFGKTTILHRLQKFYEGDKWGCCYISIHDQKSAGNALIEIASQLKLELTGAITGAEIANALLAKRGNEFGDSGKKGLVIFIDIERSWPNAPLFVQGIIKEFIPAMADTLAEKGFRKKQHNPFRVVIAGRYLVGEIHDRGPINMAEHRLHPFSYKYILETVTCFLPKEVEMKKKLAAHLMYYTAGHPGCISKILTLYKEQAYPNPDVFFDEQGEQILNEVVYPEIDIMRKGIAQGMRRVFDDLSFFRFLDASILRKMLSRSQYLGFEDEYDLENKLRSTYLMDPWAEGHFLRDGITRELIVLRLLSENGDEFLADGCQNVQHLCKQKLEDPTTQLPDKWLIEYLFQYLQQCAGKIHSRASRMQIRERFLNQVIPDGFALFSALRHAREYKTAIEKTLAEDTQFEFTANYFLRDSEYVDGTPDSPYEMLRAKLLTLVQTTR